MHPGGTIYGQPSQEPVSAASGKKTTPKKEEKPEESGGREKKKDKQPGKKGDKKQEPKKTKPKDEPPDGDDDPDWGGDDDGGDGDSDYTYEYEEEGGEEEFAEEDQSLVVTPRSERPSVRRQGSVPKAKAAPRPEPKAKAKAKAGNRPRQEVPPERSPRDRTGSAATLSAAASDLSSIRTESVRELLRNRSSDGDRSRPNIGNVKLETFRGDRNHYKDWIKIIQAQRRLYQLRDGELAVLIFLSCEGEARQVLNQLEVDDMQSEGGLGRMLRLLDDAFGSKADERFEERQGAYLGYKRLPGQSIAAYVATLKRLREEYLKEDTGTTISDKAFAQRLLQRAGLTRRERYDVFFAAGGAYKSAEIERVLRFRCAHVHKEEHGGSRGARRDEPERASASAASRRPQQAKRYPYKRGDRRKPPKPTRYAHVADNDDEVEEDPFDEDDDEDFENEDPEMEALVAEGEMPEEEEWSEEDEDLETMDEQALTEAFTAGWRAKQRTADARKSRGFKPKGKGAGKGGGDRRTPEDRKRNSTCASCGEKGHWRGDPVCRNVQSGKDPVHKKESGSYYARSSKSREVKEETPAEEMRRRKAAPWSRKPPEPKEPPPERPPLVRRPHVALPVETPRDAPPTRRKHDEVEKSKVKDSPDRQKQRTTLPGATAKSKTRPESDADPPRRRRSHREGEDRDRSRRRRRRKSREERGEEAGETPASTPRTERSEGESRAPVEGGEDLSTRQVNWTLVHGWSFLKEYESNSEAPTWESEDESSEEPDVVARFKLQDQENKREARTKLKAKLLTVLKSLADDEEDEQLRQRIRKKEKRVQERLAAATASDSGRAKSKSKPRSKRGSDVESVPDEEMGLSVQELLKILPSMNKEEKKMLYKQLKKEREDEILKVFGKDALADRTPSMMKRQDQRRDGYSAAAAQSSAAAASSSRARDSRGDRRDKVSEPPDDNADMPAGVRKKRLELFRRELYENAKDRRGRVRPSEASEIPTPLQETCEHPYNRLLWGANIHAHWATCRECKLKKVLYYSTLHGAMVEGAPQVSHDTLQSQRPPVGHVIMDTGCRTAVAGKNWHDEMRMMVRKLGLKYYPVEHEEVFRFGR
jgi:hypothetical protein